MCKCGVRGDMNVMMVQVKEEKKCEGGMYAVVTVFLNAMLWDDMGRCEKRKKIVRCVGVLRTTQLPLKKKVECSPYTTASKH